MRTSDINELLGVLRPKERENFLLFLDARFFHGAKNTDQNKRLALNLFQQFDGKLPELTDDECYRQLFPDEKRVNNKLEKLRSDTIGLFRQYLMVTHCLNQSAPVMEANAIVEFALTRKLNNHALRAIKKADEIAVHPFAQSPSMMRLLLQTTELKFRYSESTDLKNYEAAAQENRIAIESYYLRNTLHSLLLTHSFKSVSNHNSADMSREIITLLDNFQSAPYFSSNIGKLQYKIAKITVSSENTWTEHELEDLFHKLTKLIPFADSDTVFTLIKQLENQLYRMAIQFKRVDLLALEWKLVKYIRDFAPEYQAVESMIHENDFLSTIISGIQNQELAWVADFIDRMKGRIVGDVHGDDCYNLGLAHLYLAKQDWERCIDLLAQSHFSRPNHKTLVRTMEVIAYYELESVLLEPKVEALKISIYREKGLSDIYKNSCNHFVDLTKRLISNRYHGNRNRIQKILDEIRATSPLHHRSWLERKTMELLK
jgi:hypothetical protein